jgi:hypothetical protein
MLLRASPPCYCKKSRSKLITIVYN